MTDRRTGSGESKLTTLGRHFRFAARHLRQSPGFTATAVLSLAIGIGANTAIFTLVNAVLLRKAPIRAPEELVEIYLVMPDFGKYGTLSYPDFRDVRDESGEVFSSVATTRLVLIHLERDGVPQMLPGEAISGEYFPMLGLDAHLGRLLSPDDDRAPGAHPVTVLSHDFWRQEMGADPEVVGKELRLGGRMYTVIGVAPDSYAGNFRGLEPSLYVPAMMIDEVQPSTSSDLENRGNHSNFVRARLAPGINLAAAQTALDNVAMELRSRNLDNFDPQSSFHMVPTADVILYPPIDTFVRAAAWLLSIVVGLVLLLACTNLASFLLARALDRRKEIALHLALGATRRNLVARLLAETTLLGVLGGVAGTAVGAGLLHLLVNADLPLPVPITLDLKLEPTILAYTFGISLVAGCALGLAPALQTRRTDLASTLRSDARSGGPHSRSRLRGALVIAQVAASTVLLVGAGLFLRSMQRLQSVDPGFGHDPAVVLQVMVPSTRFDEAAGRQVVRRLRDELSSLPGAETVGLTANLHLNTLSQQGTAFTIDGVEPPPDREFHYADAAVVDDGFFAAAGVRIVQGRGFDESLDHANAPEVAVISEAMAARFWPGQNPVGKIIRDIDDGDVLVIGVARDAKVRSLGEAPRPFVYRNYTQNFVSGPTFVVRSAVDAERLALDVLATTRRVDPDLWIWEATTMERHLGIVRLPARLSAFLLTVFAALALLLACIGLYGVVNYAVAQRTHEVGIRMSLGASAGEMVRMLMGTGLRLVAIGCAVGLALGLGASRLLGGLLFDVGPFDPLSLAGVVVLLLGAAFLAAWIPARRAAGVSPSAALRAE
jgi:predicted permease